MTLPTLHIEMWLAAIILLVAGQVSSPGATQAELTDDQLTRLTFVQRIGTRVDAQLTFKDETGAQVRLADYFGRRPTVMMLGYYGCPMLCTLVLNGAADCFRNLTWHAGRQFNVLFVSIDPSETPALAAAKKTSYVNSYGASCAGGWHLLTGNAEAIQKLASAVGFQYAYDPAAKQFAHPSGLVILTTNGTVARYFFGVTFAASDVDASLRSATRNQTGIEESNFTLLCFHYAPVHGKYGKVIMATVRFGGLAVMVMLGCLFLLPTRPGERRREP